MLPGTPTFPVSAPLRSDVCRVAAVFGAQVIERALLSSTGGFSPSLVAPLSIIPSALVG